MKTQLTLKPYMKVDKITEIRNMATYALEGYSKIYDQKYVLINGQKVEFKKIDDYTVMI